MSKSAKDRAREQARLAKERLNARKEAKAEKSTPAPAVEAAPVTPVVQEAKPTPKIRLVADSFKMPQEDHDLIQALRKRLMLLGVDSNKTQVVRGALRAFSRLNSSQLEEIINELPKVKTGRPKNA